MLRNKKFIGTKGTFIDDESFQKIWDEVCDWFDKNIDRFVSNIQQVYALTGNEVGYSALADEWIRRREWKGVGDTPKFSADDIRNNIIDKIYCPFNWLYVHNDYGPKTFAEGFTGLLVTFHLNVQKGDEIDDFEWNYCYNLSLVIGAGKQNVI